MRDPRLPDLARRARDDDRVAEELLSLLRPAVVRATRLIVGAGSALAEDAAQEALVDIAKSLRSLKREETVYVWALRVATNRAIKVVRRERLLRRWHVLGGATPADPDPADAGGRRAAIRESFAALSPTLRAVAVLRLHAGLSERETAEVLGCPPGTVKSRLHEARHRLVKQLRSRGIEPVVLPAPTRPIDEEIHGTWTA